MARLPRLYLPGIPQHIIQRGNNRQICFNSDQDMAAYAGWLREAADKFGLAIHAWIFMSNHVHLLATPKKRESVSRAMQYLGRLYVRYYNREYRRSGTLWEGRYKSCLVQTEHYLLQCQRYIELNPVRASMVNDPSEYLWSSYAFNALGKPCRLCTPHEEYMKLGLTDSERQQAYRALFRPYLDTELLTEIRQTVHQGLVLGNNAFKDQVEANLKRRSRARAVGRPRKNLI